MPGLDRTGPQGQGSMTGGARGNCNTANMQNARPVMGNQRFGRGMAYGRRNFRGGNGFSMGMRRGYAANAGWNTGNSADELSMLKTEVELLNKRIAELENTL
ncbi:MAG: DUF5320 domain-containing protein [Desulfobacteraceae bacterium]|nr:DUF5320 domain-containing protein [Desulfobacteraceae bacterium]